MTATMFELPGFGGSLFRPGDSGYDDARHVFNGMIDNLFRHSQNIPPA